MSQGAVLERKWLACGNIVMDIGACFPTTWPEGVIEANPLNAPVRIRFNISNVTRPSRPESGTNFLFDTVLAQFLPPTNDAKQNITSCLTSGICNPQPCLIDLFKTAIIEYASEVAMKAWCGRKQGFNLIVIIIAFLTPEVLEQAAQEIDGLFVFDNLMVGESDQAQVATLMSRMQTVEFGKDCRIEDVNECPFCLIEYEVGMKLKKTLCSHVFHENCLLPWLKRGGSCPLCRATLASTT